MDMVLEELARWPRGLEWDFSLACLILWRSSRSLQGGWHERFQSDRSAKASVSDRPKPWTRPTAAV
jgi:hypothetical protein